MLIESVKQSSGSWSNISLGRCEWAGP